MISGEDQTCSLEMVAKRLHQIQVKEHALVTGLLVDESNKIIYECKTSVLERLSSGEYFLVNPTSHCEKNIISWYWQNRIKLHLSPPQQLTIISSLDPCLMCASSIIASGFNVGTISLDYHAGVNFRQNAFEDYKFSKFFSNALLNTFGYYKIRGVESRAQYHYNAQKIAFKQQEISKQTEELVRKHFVNNLGAFIEAVSHSSSQTQKKEIKLLPEENKLKKNLKTLDQNAFSITLWQKVKVNGQQTKFYQPTGDIQHLLTKLVQQTPLAKNAVALIDPFGNFLLARPDRFDISPISSAICNVVSDYSEFRFTQIRRQTKVNESEAYHYLPSLGDCTFIFLNALPSDDPISLQTIGIYGSSVESFAPKGGLLYINDYLDPTLALQPVICHLPPLYRQHICPMQATVTKYHQVSSVTEEKPQE